VNEKFDVKLGRASLNHSAWFYVPGGNVYQIILQKDLDVMECWEYNWDTGECAR